MEIKKRPIRNICKITGCESPHEAKGYCSKHYVKFKYASGGGRPCKLPECKKTHYAKGFCRYHYYTIGDSQRHQKLKQAIKKWKENHRDQENKRGNQWYKEHPDKRREKLRQWRIKNLEKLKNPKHRLDNAIHGGIWRSLQKINQSKNGKKWEEFVGYNLDQLMIHLEFKFQGNMSWDNYGKWHIDHIIPKRIFLYAIPKEENFKKCWSLGNLQPLWAEENIRKGGRI